MERRRRFWILGLGALAVVAVAVERPHADIRILTHAQGDLAPQRLQAAIDLGLVGISFLVTWSKKLAS
jgi:hypothetical protein